MDKYHQFALDLFPNGSPWPKDRASLLWETAGILGPHIRRRDERLEQILKEMDPREADILLSRWEKELEISGEGLSKEQRQEQAYKHYLGALDLNTPELIKLVESITGKRPTIKTPYPLTVGELRAGDELDAEATAFTIYVEGVPASRKLFEALKEYTEGHVLMVIDTGTKKIPVKGLYEEN